jgi:hypothetical protein
MFGRRVDVRAVRESKVAGDWPLSLRVRATRFPVWRVQREHPAIALSFALTRQRETACGAIRGSTSNRSALPLKRIAPTQ